MTSKISFNQIKQFWQDPAGIKNKGQDPQFSTIFPFFLKAYQAVSEIMKQEEALISELPRQGGELVKKYVKSISVSMYPGVPSQQNPNPQPMRVLTHLFEPVEKYDEFDEAMKKAQTEHSQKYAEFCNLEHEIEVDYCPVDKFPRPDLFTLEQQKAYIGFCIEPPQANMAKV